jgi:hypothetical protein
LVITTITCNLAKLLVVIRVIIHTSTQFIYSYIYIFFVFCIIILGCIVFGLYHTTPLPARDLIRRQLPGYSVIGNSQVSSECRFKMILKYTVEQCILIHNGHVKSDTAHVCHTEFEQKFSGVDTPTRSVIHYFVINSCYVFSIVQKKKQPASCHC